MPGTGSCDGRSFGLAGGSTAVYKENKDEQMEDNATYSSSTMPTQTLAHLAAKLKKLMQMEEVETLPTEVNMEIDVDKQKMRAHASTP